MGSVLRGDQGVCGLRMNPELILMGFYPVKWIRCKVLGIWYKESEDARVPEVRIWTYLLAAPLNELRVECRFCSGMHGDLLKGTD